MSLEWGAQGAHSGPGPGARWAHSRASLLSQEQAQRRQMGPGLAVAMLNVFVIFSLRMCIFYDGARAWAQRAWNRSSCRVSPPAASAPSWGDSAAGCAPTRWGTRPFFPAAAAVSCPLSLVPGRGLASRRGKAGHVRAVMAEDRAWGWWSCLEPAVSQCVQQAPWWGEPLTHLRESHRALLSLRPQSLGAHLLWMEVTGSEETG